MVFIAPPLATKRTSLLGDRLTAQLPEGMAIMPRRPSLMAAENASEDETRGILDQGKTRFVMMVHELYELAGPDLHADVAADLARTNQRGTLERLVLPTSLVGCAFTPETFTADQQANLVYTAWIASVDNAVQLVAFYTNPDGAADAAALSALARETIASLECGTRALDLVAGQRELDSLRITVPAGWGASTKHGPDFVVHHLHKLVPFGIPGVGCSVYVGHHPSPQYEQQSVKVTPTRTAGTMFGSSIEWLTWRTQYRWTTEMLVKHPATNAAVHVFCSSPNEADLVALREIASTLRAP